MHRSIAHSKEIILRVVIKFSKKKTVGSDGCYVISTYLRIRCNLLVEYWLYIRVEYLCTGFLKLYIIFEFHSGLNGSAQVFLEVMDKPEVGDTVAHFRSN